MIYLCNGLSIHMLEALNCGESHRLKIQRIPTAEAGQILRENRFRSYFGHVDTAKHLEKILRVHIPPNRETLDFTRQDVMIIATLSSKREWEKGSKPAPGFKFYLVEYEE